MRKTIDKGVFVKVRDVNGLLRDSVDTAKEMGATSKLNLSRPVNGSEGEVMAIKDGYTLVDFGTYECLMDSDSLMVAVKPEEIKFLVRFMQNNSIEEFVSEDDIAKKLEEYVRSGSMRIDTPIKVYPVNGSKIISMKLNVSLT